MESKTPKHRTTGARIKQIRLSLGLNMEEFGKKFKPVASKSIVSRWEKGVSLPSAERLSLIAKIGNVPVNYLLNSDLMSTSDLNQRVEKILNGRTLEEYQLEKYEDVYGHKNGFSNEWPNEFKVEIFKALNGLESIAKEIVPKNIDDLSELDTAKFVTFQNLLKTVDACSERFAILSAKETAGVNINALLDEYEALSSILRKNSSDIILKNICD